MARGVNYTTADIFGGGARSSSSNTPNPEAGTTRATVGRQVPWAEDHFPELSRMNASPRPDPLGDEAAEHSLAAIQVPGDASTWGAGRHNPSTFDTRSSETPTTGSGSTSTARPNNNPRLPRRRASVILSPPTTGSTSSTSSTSHPPASNNTDPDTSANNPWRTIEDAMRLDRGPLFESASRATPPTTTTNTRPTRAEIDAEIAAERAARVRTLGTQRDRWRALASDGTQPPNAYATGANATPATISRLAAFPDGYEAVLRRMRVGGITGREMGVRTAGLAMSGDGATVWAACEEGIFELKVGRKGRLFWPAVEMT